MRFVRDHQGSDTGYLPTLLHDEHVELPAGTECFPPAFEPFMPQENAFMRASRHQGVPWLADRQKGVEGVYEFNSEAAFHATPIGNQVRGVFCVR